MSSKLACEEGMPASAATPDVRRRRSRYLKLAGGIVFYFDRSIPGLVEKDFIREVEGGPIGRAIEALYEKAKAAARGRVHAN